MRALLSTIGSRGDVQSLVALALALKALGQEARLCVPPDFCAWVGTLGLAVTPIGPQLRSFGANNPGPPPAVSPEQRRRLVEESVATQFETVAAAAEGCDIIVAATALQIAARSVAEKKSIPYAFAAYCPNVLPSPHHAPPPLPPMPGQTPLPSSAGNRERWTRDAERFGSLFGPPLNLHRASIGLALVTDVQRHVFTDRPWLAADPTLAPWPDAGDGAVLQTGAWMLKDDRPLPREVEAFLDGGEPPVYFGLGSMRAPQEVGHVMIESARALGRRTILLRGWADLSLADDRSDCIAIEEINQQALFRRVGAVVHHGGAGTTTAAASAGAPQVVIPQIYDQHYFAARVRELGIGAAHAPGTPTVESLTAALQEALDPGVALRARTLGVEVRDDGAVTAARHVVAAAR